MKLRNMQDIGGCRAILSNQKKVFKLVKELKKRKLFRMKQYIKRPKDDGYRGVHLIGDFGKSGSTRRAIEIQLRTKIQHSWATAVEINDLFTGQAIKSNQGTDQWKKFFQCTAEMFSRIEKMPDKESGNPKEIGRALANIIVMDDPGLTRSELFASCEEIYVLCDKLKVLDNFNGYANSLKIADQHLSERPIDGYVLINIDTKKTTVRFAMFEKAEFLEAADEYLKAEKLAASSDEKVVALVSTDAVGGLKEAYPNYFADSSNFLRLLMSCIIAYKHYNPSNIKRLFKRLF